MRPLKVETYYENYTEIEEIVQEVLREQNMTTEKNQDHDFRVGVFHETFSSDWYYDNFGDKDPELVDDFSDEYVAEIKVSLDDVNEEVLEKILEMLESCFDFVSCVELSDKNTVVLKIVEPDRSCLPVKVYYCEVCKREVENRELGYYCYNCEDYVEDVSMKIFEQDDEEDWL